MDRREATQPKKSMERANIKKKFIHGNETYELKQLAQQTISQITVGSMIKTLAPWTLKPKIQIQIKEKLFQQSFFIEYVD